MDDLKVEEPGEVGGLRVKWGARIGDSVFYFETYAEAHNLVLAVKAYVDGRVGDNGVFAALSRFYQHASQTHRCAYCGEVVTLDPGSEFSSPFFCSPQCEASGS